MVKFLDLKAVNSSFEPALTNAVKRVVESGWYLQGAETKAFEEEFAKYLGVGHCVGVANGLDALRIALRAYIELGVLQRGDEVIVPANTYIASVLAISENGLTPVLVEPAIETYNIDYRLIEEKISERTKAIMVVHLYGQNAISKHLMELVKKYNLKLVEDNAQATGACFNNQRTGSLGDVAGHSFYPGKNLGCLGDGGAITTNDADLAMCVRQLANYGSSQKYVHEVQGLNSRLDELQAAVLRVKLKRLDYDNENRVKLAEYYTEHIKHSKIIKPNHAAKGTHVFHLYVIQTKERERLQNHLLNHGIETLIHYPIPPHKQKAFSRWNHLTYPVTERIHNQVLSLPMSPIMTMQDVRCVTEVINSW